jgi:hypothetical protein
MYTGVVSNVSIGSRAFEFSVFIYLAVGRATTPTLTLLKADREGLIFTYDLLPGGSKKGSPWNLTMS